MGFIGNVISDGVNAELLTEDTGLSLRGPFTIVGRAIAVYSGLIFFINI